jgi:hypothetical protein
MRTIRSFNEFMWSLVIFFVLCLYASVVRAQEVRPQSEWVKGGVYVGRSNSGSCVSKPFVKVGDAEDNADDGKPQILGYDPTNIQKNYKGDIVWERVYEELFDPLNHPFHNTPCKCPPFNE